MRGKTVWLLALLGAGVLITGCETVGGWFDDDVAEIEGDDPQSRRLKKLVVDLQADDPQVQVAAAEELARSGSTREGVLDALEQALRDDDRAVREAAAQALGRIGGYEAIVRLREASEEGWQEAREEYAAIVADLRVRARDGDAAARDLLDRLGERGL